MPGTDHDPEGVAQELVKSFQPSLNLEPLAYTVTSSPSFLFLTQKQFTILLNFTNSENAHEPPAS